MITACNSYLQNAYGPRAVSLRQKQQKSSQMKGVYPHLTPETSSPISSLPSFFFPSLVSLFFSVFFPNLVRGYGERSAVHSTLYMSSSSWVSDRR